jgi:FkbM family methyltransferase
MNQGQVSIIVPVYNSKNTIERCIYSILLQQYKQIEIIVVDDNSIDGTKQIVERIRKEDDRVKVILLEKNYGTYYARQIGIDNARGEYIGFVDADDWIDCQMYDLMIKKINEYHADVVQCEPIHVLSNGENYIPKNYEGILEGQELQSRIDMNDGKPTLTPFVWNKLYRRIIFDNLKFEDNYYEDMAFTIRMQHTVKSVYVMTDTLYFYNRKGESKLNTLIKRDNFLTMFNALIEAYSIKLEYIRSIVKDYQVSTENSFIINIKRFSRYLREKGDECLIDITSTILKNHKVFYFLIPNWIEIIKKNVGDKFVVSLLSEIIKQQKKLGFRKELVVLYYKYINNKCILSCKKVRRIIIESVVNKIRTPIKKYVKSKIERMIDNKLNNGDINNKIMFLTNEIDSLKKLVSVQKKLLGECEMRIKDSETNINNVNELIRDEINLRKDINVKIWTNINRYIKLEKKISEIFFKGQNINPLNDGNIINNFIVPCLINDIEYMLKDKDIVYLYDNKRNITLLTDSYYWMLVDTYFTKKYELPNEICRNDHIVIDLGMNRAYTSLFYASNIKCKFVIGYEPFVKNYEFSIMSLSKNKDIAQKIFAINKGVYDKSCKLKGHYSSKRNGASCIDIDPNRNLEDYMYSEEEVELVDIVEIVKEHVRDKNINYILKIDIEGSEYKVFRRLNEKKLLRSFSYIVGEYHNYSKGIRDVLTENIFEYKEDCDNIKQSNFYAIRV